MSLRNTMTAVRVVTLSSEDTAPFGITFPVKAADVGAPT
jgi:hypothetical protein